MPSDRPRQAAFAARRAAPRARGTGPRASLVCVTAGAPRRPSRRRPAASLISVSRSIAQLTAAGCSSEHAGRKGDRGLHAASSTSRVPALSQAGPDQQTPTGLDLHLIVDNYATHKTPAVKRWIKAHPRFHLHFTPTSASWLNMVERFFAEIAAESYFLEIPRLRPDT